MLPNGNGLFKWQFFRIVSHADFRMKRLPNAPLTAARPADFVAANLRRP